GQRLFRPVHQLAPGRPLLFGPVQRDPEFLRNSMRALGSMLTMRWAVRGAMALAAAITVIVSVPSPAPASEGEKPVARIYPKFVDAPRTQDWAQADAKSDGCTSCHTASDRKTMHQTEA